MTPRAAATTPSDLGERGGDPYDALADQTNLTKDQLLVWAGQQVHPDHRRYSELALFHIDGVVDVARFREALATVVRTHDALRIVVDPGGSWPKQGLCEQVAALEVWDRPAERDPEPVFRRSLDAWSAQPFPPQAPPWRSLLVRRAPDRFVWALLQHQLIGDAWSFGLIFRSLRRAYSTAEGSGASTPAPQFLEYVEWERAHRRSRAYARAATYWREQLARGGTALGFYEGRRSDGGGRVHRVGRDLGATAPLIEELAARLPGGFAELNLFSVFCTAAVAYVARLGGLREVVVGVPYANRGSQRFKDTVGTFMHICPLRIDLDPDEPVYDLLQRVRAEALVVSGHQQYAVRNPMPARLYDLVVNYQRHVWVGRDLDGCPVRVEWPSLGVGNHALAVQVGRYASEGSFEVALDMNDQAFSEPYRKAALAHYVAILTHLVAAPRTSTGQLRLEASPSMVPVPTTAGAPRAWSDATLPALVARRVVEHPTRIAVVGGDETWTYGQLWDSARRVAGHLRARGIAAGALVGTAVERDPQGWAIVLGILMGGAAYLPIDRDHPPRRIARILRQARCRAIVASSASRQAIVAALETVDPDVPLTVIDGCDLFSGVGTTDEELHGPKPEDLFYVIFTSGSTGVPKGIMVEHRGMANHTAAKIEVLGIGEGDRVAQIAPMTFDVSVWQWFAPLCMGGEVHLLSEGVAREPRQLLGELARRRITVAATVPSMLRALVETIESAGREAYDLRALRWLVVTGEVLPPSLCRRWLAVCPDIPLVNAYGPSECSDDVAHQVVVVPPAPEDPRVPIGRPIANTRIWVLDERLTPVPDGMLGELWIGGIGVARGYLDDPVRTAERFIADPFSRTPGARLYRTGDLGWRRADGALEFYGRRDRLTKIRGHRVELEEIEAVLRAHPCVRDAVVTSPEDATGTRRLLAYVVPVPEVSPEALEAQTIRGFVAQHLPPCMVPAPVRVVARLPLTAHGKVDHAALVDLDANGPVRTEIVRAPRTAIEAALVEIWTEVLEVRSMGVDDDFFALGGDSLRAAHLTHRVREHWMVELAVREVLDHPTVRELGLLLQDRIATTGTVLADVLREAEQMSEADACSASGAER